MILRCFALAFFLAIGEAKANTHLEQAWERAQSLLSAAYHSEKLPAEWKEEVSRMYHASTQATPVMVEKCLPGNNGGHRVAYVRGRQDMFGNVLEVDMNVYVCPIAQRMSLQELANVFVHEMAHLAGEFNECRAEMAEHTVTHFGGGMSSHYGYQALGVCDSSYKEKRAGI